MNIKTAVRHTIDFFAYPDEYGKEIPCEVTGFDCIDGDVFAILKCTPEENKEIIAIYSDKIGTYSKHKPYIQKTAHKEAREMYKVASACRRDRA